MNSETLQKIDSLKEAVPSVSEYLDEFVQQAKAAVDLFSRCEIHPGLHAFMNMDAYRMAILQAESQAPLKSTLYSSNSSENKMFMDSIFDECIDDIVENGFKKCAALADRGPNPPPQNPYHWGQYQ
jgi:hypothetical protein